MAAHRCGSSGIACHAAQHPARQTQRVAVQARKQLSQIYLRRLLRLFRVNQQHRVLTLARQYRQRRTLVRVTNRWQLRQAGQGRVDTPGLKLVAQTVGGLNQCVLRPQCVPPHAGAQRIAGHRLLMPGQYGQQAGLERVVQWFR